MTTLLWWLAVNTVTAAVLIPVVLAAGRLFRHRPAVQHLLWAVVVLKFVTPPVVSWPWIHSPTVAYGSGEVVSEFAPPQPPLGRGGERMAASLGGAVKESAPADEHLPNAAAGAVFSPPWQGGAGGGLSDSPNSERSPFRSVSWAANAAFVVWLIAGLGWLALQFRRIARHGSVVRTASPASSDLLAEVRAVATRLGVTAPKTLLARGISSPFIWCVGRPTLVWPAALAGAEARGIIAHELAHLRRGDHWVAWLELAAGAAWWWNPLFRFARRRLREAAEMACDALAIRTAPDARRGYAELLLRLSAGASLAAPAPVLGVGAGSSSSFERRLSMILSDRVSGTASVRGVLVAGALALAALPGWSPAQGPAAPPAPTSQKPKGNAGPYYPSPDPDQADRKILEGNDWIVVLVEVPGSKIKPKTRVRFQGENCFIMEPETNSVIPAKFKINADKNPKWVDVTSVTKKARAGEADTTVTHLGIYEIDGDKMRAVFQNDPNGKRPTDFKAEEGGTVMYTYERGNKLQSPAVVPPVPVPGSYWEAGPLKIVPQAVTPATAASPPAVPPTDESLRIRGKEPAAAPAALPYVPAPAARPAAGLDFSALDLGERYLRAEAALKSARNHLQVHKPGENAAGTQAFNEAMVAAELAERQLKLVKDFILAVVKQAEGAYEFANAELYRGVKLADQGALSLSEIVAMRAKVQDAEARLKQLKTVAALVGK